MSSRPCAGDKPLEAYERLAEQGVLRYDEAQHRALGVLDELHATVTGKKPMKQPAPAATGAGAGSWFGRMFVGGAAEGPPPRDGEGGFAGGVYMYGGPGCGKTFCMDLAYACLPGADGMGKRREHFHSFMMATHNALHKLGKGDSTRDTVAMFAADIADKTSVLCLDEFQVTDVADAMIIRRLLDQLWLR